MKSSFTFVLLGAALLAASTSAEAGTRTVQISGSDLIDGSGAPLVFGASLPDASTNPVLVNLTLPKDFKSNSTAKLTLRMAVGSASCGVALRADGTYRFRPGKVISAVPGPTSGLTIAGATTVVAPAVGFTIFTKSLILAPAAAGGVLGQQAGDSVIAFISRVGGDASDTCASSLLVTSVKFEYKTP